MNIEKIPQAYQVNLDRLGDTAAVTKPGPVTRKPKPKAKAKKVAPKKVAPKKVAPKKVAPKKVAPKKVAPEKEKAVSPDPVTKEEKAK